MATGTSKWREGDLINAIEEVQDGSLSVRRAAGKYGIPKCTLHDYLTQKVEIGTRPGPDHVIGKDLEAELVKWVLEMDMAKHAHRSVKSLKRF